MFSFTAHFYENEICINKKFAYKNNEFLTELLNLDITDDLNRYRTILMKEPQYLRLFGDMSDYEIESYNAYAQNIQAVMNNLDFFYEKLSISKLISNSEFMQTEKLFTILSSITWIWEKPYSETDSDWDDNEDDYEEDYVNDFGFSYPDLDSSGCHVYRSQLTKFIPSELSYSLDCADMGLDLEDMNAQVEKLCKSYLTFTEDILRVIHLYHDFVDNYLNAQSKFLDSDNLANAFVSFIDSTKKKPDRNYFKFTSGYSKFFHSVIKEGDKNIFCASYEFQSIGAFLYFDLFHGIQQNYIPKKCMNCGTYFLIKSGKYTDYCNSPSPQDNSKTCREIGSRKKYDDKCKTDPVWQTYNRAYKAHYARYMKKKMTVAEFEKWSAWAVAWRTKAENDEISFEEYVTEIKK